MVLTERFEGKPRQQCGQLKARGRAQPEHMCAMARRLRYLTRLTYSCLTPMPQGEQSLVPGDHIFSSPECMYILAGPSYGRLLLRGMYLLLHV